MQRDVGLLEQVVDVLRVIGEERDAHGRLDGDRNVVDDERLLDRLAHAVDDVRRAVGSAHVGEEDAELVCAEPRDRVSRAERAP